MGVAFDAGVPMIEAIGLALVTGTVCGLINGIILVKFPELGMIVTLATQIIFRGIAQIILETNSVEDSQIGLHKLQPVKSVEWFHTH